MNDLNTRLANHIATMAPHQRERQGGKLLLEAAARIAELEKELAIETIENTARIRILDSMARLHENPGFKRVAMGNPKNYSDPTAQIICRYETARELGLPANDKWVQKK